jgi:hypothetical protein
VFERYLKTAKTGGFDVAFAEKTRTVIRHDCFGVGRGDSCVAAAAGYGRSAVCVRPTAAH